MGVPGTNGQLLRGWVGNAINALCSTGLPAGFPKMREWSASSDGGPPPATGDDSLIGYVEKITNFPAAATAPVTHGWEPGPETGANAVSFIDFIETEVEQACLSTDPAWQDVRDWLEGNAPSSPTTVPAPVVEWIADRTAAYKVTANS